MAGHEHRSIPQPTQQRLEWTTRMVKELTEAIRDGIESVLKKHTEDIESVEDVQWEKAVIMALNTVMYDSENNLNDGISFLENGEV